MTDESSSKKTSLTPRLDKLRDSVDYWLDAASMEFVQGILGLMRKQEVTGAKLADLYGSSQANISKTLSTGQNCKLRTMVKLANALEATVHVAVVSKNEWFHYETQPKSNAPIAQEFKAADSQPTDEGGAKVLRPLFTKLKKETKTSNIELAQIQISTLAS